MKIISPFKDFYDFEVAKYGLDPLLVYRRGIGQATHDYPLARPRLINPQYSTDWVVHAILWVGDELIHLFISDHAVYSHFDLANPQDFAKTLFFNHIPNAPRQTVAKFDGRNPTLAFNNGEQYYCYSQFFCYWKTTNIFNAGHYFRNVSPIFQQTFRHYYDDAYYFENQQLAEDDFAELLTTPILLLQQFEEPKQSIRYCHSEYHDPNLQQLGIYIKPEFIWQALVAFLSRLKSDKEIMPEVANDDKIRNKGFDIKRSFRPNMK